MKYMGSKRWQLENGLGTQLRRVAKSEDSFVDLFTGSGAVSWFAAEQLGLPVTAVDLQEYAVTIAGAVIERDRALDSARLIRQWTAPVWKRVGRDAEVAESRKLLTTPLTARAVSRMRNLAGDSKGVFTRSYAGYYYSIEQARTLDMLHVTLPTKRPDHTVCLAALIIAASRCSASPGHTAQPFRPTAAALPHIDTIWRRNFLNEVEGTLATLCARRSEQRGSAVRADANDIVQQLNGRELVFVDPPYSAAQYSRFYHVLEAIAVGGYDTVNGAGRAPDLANRESSAYSCVSSAKESLTELLQALAEKECRVIATFPQYKASNGLAGEDIADIARQWFSVDLSATSSRFSTLGGNGTKRAARQHSQELVLTLFPR